MHRSRRNVRNNLRQDRVNPRSHSQRKLLHAHFGSNRTLVTSCAVNPTEKRAEKRML